MKRLLVLTAIAASFCAHAQTFPGSKPISIVVPFAAGGPTDRVARDLAEAMRKAMGGSANFVVENVNGAGGTIGGLYPVTYTEGTVTVLPTDVTKPGYTFLGWFTAPSGGRVNASECA